VKCRRCRQPAVIEIRRNNSAFCAACFPLVFREQVRRAVRRFDMFEADDRIVVAVSGGKDSLALWEVLLDEGYDATGLYLGLGIEAYSARSLEVTRAFATERGAALIEADLERDYGFDIPNAGRRGSRSSCGVCGLSKRYVFNRAAVQGGFDVIATGHNLDDEAATLLGNTLRWNTASMARQSPILSAKPGMVKKVKPLHRLSELETAAYAFLRGIDYVVEECPLVAGNTQLRYKDALNGIESTSPGTKAAFFLGYLDRARPLFAEADDAVLVACESCEAPTTGRFCAFCRARAQVLGERLGGHSAVPLDARTTAEGLSEEVLPVEIYGAVSR